MSIGTLVASREALCRTMPERAEIEVLKKRMEIALTSGVVEMTAIVNEDPLPDNKIKAFNALINLGKYIEKRRENDYNLKDDEEIEDDLNFTIGDAKNEKE